MELTLVDKVLIALHKNKIIYFIDIPKYIFNNPNLNLNQGDFVLENNENQNQNNRVIPTISRDNSHVIQLIYYSIRNIENHDNNINIENQIESETESENLQEENNNNNENI